MSQKYGRALVVLPYVSIVNEKSAHLETVLKPMHASVKGFCGGAEEGAAVQPLAPRCAALLSVVVNYSAQCSLYCMCCSSNIAACHVNVAACAAQGRDGGDLHHREGQRDHQPAGAGGAAGCAVGASEATVVRAFLRFYDFRWHVWTMLSCSWLQCSAVHANALFLSHATPCRRAVLRGGGRAAHGVRHRPWHRPGDESQVS